MRGKLGENMSREQAEAEAAAYAAARGRAHLERLETESSSLTRQRDAVRNADAEFEAALAEFASAVEADPSAAGDARAVAEDARRRLAAIEHRRQAEEAIAAGTVALAKLRAAQKELGSASSWSTWDTWGSGGLVSSMMKHNRLDTASATLAEASQALGVLTRELQDVNVQLPGVSAPIVGSFARGIDIFFDNIFTDLMVGDQIRDASAQVDAAIANVELTMTALENVRASVADA